MIADGSPATKLARLVAPLFVVLLAMGPAASDPVKALMANLPDKVQAALELMDGDDRRLLALRSYLRSARTLEDRWSWTAEEIERYQGSEAQKKALEAVDAVISAFEERNPGYSLYVNTRVRSLDEQIDKWNRNDTVSAGAAEIAAGLKSWLTDHPEAGEADVRSFLKSFSLDTTVSLAAPGLTAHGRAHAFDFQVMQDGSIVVGANTRIIETVWNADGWTDRLKQAVTASGAPFVGPLERPHEPWHYDYVGWKP